MKILLIDCGANFLDFALRCRKANHEVKWFIAPDKNGERLKVGDGLVEKVSDFTRWMRWADIIVLSDNVKYLHMLEPYRKYGYPIFGCNVAAQQMELDRTKGQDVLKKAGVPIMDYKTFTDYDSAIAFVKKTMKRYVSKPSGDADKALSYVSKSPADMVYMLERWKKMGKLKAPFILQEFCPGIEMAVGGYFGPGGWNSHFLVNFEQKKLMPGDLGVNTGEMGCYSADTEVLTRSGWKLWPHVTIADELATQDDSGRLVYESPSAVVSFDCIEPLYHWESPYVDLMVTGNHNMWVQDSHARKPFAFMPAEHCADKNLLVSRAAHAVDAKDEVTPELAELMGAYIADGNLKTSGGRSIVFGNVPPHKETEWKRIIEAAGYPFHKYGKDVYVNSIDLYRSFEKYGKAKDKFVPPEVLRSSATVQEAFLRGYLIGDGARQGASVCATTISRRLADDLQILASQIGVSACISVRDRVGQKHVVNGRDCVNRHVSYEVRFSMSRPKAMLNPKDFCRVPYAGKVYCATVRSHLLYVRRNGKPVWCGNTIMRFVKKSKLAEKLLFPISDYLKEIGYTGYIDAAAIIDAKGEPNFLEFTCRFGWPCFQIEQPLHLGDPVVWMKDLLEGYDSMEVSEDVSVGVVCAMPDFPYNQKPRSDLTGIPVYCDIENPNIHPADIKAGTAPNVVGNKVIDLPTWVTAGNYILVATGTGKTVSSARAKAYKTLDGIEIPNSPFWRNDIGDRLKKQLPELHALGYAKEFEY